MHGPMGAKVSKLLPIQLPWRQVRRPSPRAETSMMPVKPNTALRHGRGPSRWPLAGGPQRVETVDVLRHEMLWRGGHHRRGGGRDAHHTRLGQHAGTDTPTRSWSLK